MRSLGIVRIHWRDATHYRTESEIDWYEREATTTDFVTIGHLIRKKGREVVVALEINDDDKARDVSVIPKELISKIEYLNVK